MKKVSDERLLDATDFALIRHLQDDARISNARLARKVGVSEPTVRKRLDMLIGEGIVRTTAILDPKKTGYECDVIIALQVEPTRLFEVGRQFSSFDQVVYLGYTTGRFHILVELLFEDIQGYATFLEEQLSRVEGIVSFETSQVLRAERYDVNLRVSVNGSDGILAHPPNISRPPAAR